MGSIAHDPPSATSREDLIGKLDSLRRMIEEQAKAGRSLLDALTPEQRPAAENLLHYLALRRHDLRPLQEPLARLGMSSLGCAEASVLPTIKAVLRNLYLLEKMQVATSLSCANLSTTPDLREILERNTQRLFGEPPQKRRTHIMVTMSSEAADDYLLVHQLVSNGMNCLRINCSHDDVTTWSRTIDHLRDAERATGRSCRILMDLAGPKLRIGPMETTPAVLKIRPQRNSHGQVTRSARIWLYAENSFAAMEAADANLSVDSNWLQSIAVDDRVVLKDARGSNRKWRVREVCAEGCWAEAKKTAYLINGCVLRLRDGENREETRTVIQNLPAVESQVLLRTGDVLMITAGKEPGKPALHDPDGKLLNPGKISLPYAEIYRDARPGERICFDDGRIAGMIEKVDATQIQLRITHTRKPVEKLSRDKGVNLPDTHLRLPALGTKDLADLEFVARHADMIGLSFANSPDDVRALREHLQEMACDDVAIVLKIETTRGFSNLPAMLFEAMKFPACGVMIARGDLGVEVGFERMAEVQEEIMWLCEAAGVPVIWATQVLEGLTKRGHATRAEVTDAAMSQAAECVMLNKGPYIVEAVRMLDDILRRMQDHRDKKRPLLRKLRVALQFRPDTIDSSG